MAGGKSSSPIWLENASSSDAVSTILRAVERAPAQQHALELEVVARRRVEAVAGGEPLRLLRPVDVRRLPRAGFAAQVHRHRVGPLVGAHQERRLGHPQRAEDVLGEVGVEGLAAGGFDHEPEPVGVDAVLEPRAGVGDERQREHLALAGQRVPGAGERLVTDHVGAPEPVGEAARVARELTHRGLRGRRAQARLVAVEALEHLQVGELGPVGLHRRVEVQVAALDLLQRRDGAHHLRHRGDPEQRVGRDRAVLPGRPRPRRSLVDRAALVGGHRHHLGHDTPVDGCLQDRVDTGAHGRSPSALARATSVLRGAPAVNAAGAR